MIPLDDRDISDGLQAASLESSCTPPLVFSSDKTGIIKLPHLGGIQQYKCMVIFRDFLLMVHCLGR